jgi:hypothetical protein
MLEFHHLINRNQNLLKDFCGSVASGRVYVNDVLEWQMDREEPSVLRPVHHPLSRPHLGRQRSWDVVFSTYPVV